MPANHRSLQLTDAYRIRLKAIRKRVDGLTEWRWRTLMPADLDGTRWIESITAALTTAQTEAVRATSGYLSAFVTSETGKRQQLVLDSRRYAGKSRDGRPLAEALQSPLIGAKAKLKDGEDLDTALDYGLNRALRNAGLDTDQAARFSLLDAIDEDDRLEGWTRAVSGTCGACLAATDEDTDTFEAHPNCQCVPEPRVRGVHDLAPRLIGAALFASMTLEHQDEALGPEAAEAVRNGLPLHKLVQRDPMETEQDFISQRPLAELQ